MIEYVVLILLIMGALFVMQKYLTRNTSGRWKTAADSFGYGRQYDYRGTLECMTDGNVEDYFFYNLTCYDQNCDCESLRATCPSTMTECKDYRKTHCTDCKHDCRVPACN